MNQSKIYIDYRFCKVRLFGFKGLRVWAEHWERPRKSLIGQDGKPIKSLHFKTCIYECSNLITLSEGGFDILSLLTPGFLISVMKLCSIGKRFVFKNNNCPKPEVSPTKIKIKINIRLIVCQAWLDFCIICLVAVRANLTEHISCQAAIVAKECE